MGLETGQLGFAGSRPLDGLEEKWVAVHDSEKARPAAKKPAAKKQRRSR